MNGMQNGLIGKKVSINDFINGKSKICQPYSPNLKLWNICKIVWKSL